MSIHARTEDMISRAEYGDLHQFAAARVLMHVSGTTADALLMPKGVGSSLRQSLSRHAEPVRMFQTPELLTPFCND